MNDTEAEKTAPGADIPNFAVVKIGMMASSSQPIYSVTFGSRKISMVQLDLPSQWDLLEIARGGVEDSPWFNIATIAATVRDVDGVAISPSLGAGPDAIKAEIRRRLAKLGSDGLRAASAALARMTEESATTTTDDVLATAGN